MFVCMSVLRFVLFVLDSCYAASEIKLLLVLIIKYIVNNESVHQKEQHTS